jgi:hypothetical protein
MQARPIPTPWIAKVVEILQEGDTSRIEWTFTAEQTWGQFGLEQQAYELIIKTLQAREVLGHAVVGMRNPVDLSYTDCWAFFCDHPWNSPIPLYTKIGIHHSRIRINLFSLHVDDGSEQLQKAIAAYRKKHKK